MSPGAIRSSFSAARAVTGLKIEPVGYRPWVARFASGASFSLRDQRLVLALGDRPGEDLGVEARGRAHREDLAVVDAHGDVGPGQAERAERAVGQGLEVGVDRQPDVVAGRRALAAELAGRAAERVHLEAVGARLAAQEAVVLVLDAGLADRVALLEPSVAGQVELLGGDLSDVAEQVGGDVALAVVAREDALDRHAREAVAVLPEVEDLAGAEPLGQDHRALRRLLADARDLGLHLPGAVAGDRLQALHHGRALVGAGLRQVARLDVEGELGLVGDQDLAVAVDDVAPRRLDPHLPDAVVVRLLAEVVAREHLEVPEAQEDDGEDRHGDAHQHRRPARKRGRARRFVGSVPEHHVSSAPVPVVAVPGAWRHRPAAPRAPRADPRSRRAAAQV